LLPIVSLASVSSSCNDKPAAWPRSGHCMSCVRRSQVSFYSRAAIQRNADAAPSLWPRWPPKPSSAIATLYNTREWECCAPSTTQPTRPSLVDTRFACQGVSARSHLSTRAYLHEPQYSSPPDALPLPTSARRPNRHAPSLLSCYTPKASKHVICSISQQHPFVGRCIRPSTECLHPL